MGDLATQLRPVRYVEEKVVRAKSFPGKMFLANFLRRNIFVEGNFAGELHARSSQDHGPTRVRRGYTDERNILM